jgi:phosphatidyl-myo-inositol alpha-mannosyltransferase
MGTQENVRFRMRLRVPRHWLIALALVFAAALVALALSQLDLRRVGHALITATPGWIVAALVLMGSSLVMRSISWRAVLHAALPTTPIRWPPVVRATMIGVMGSAVFPGRIGEAARVLVLSRRIEGRTRRLVPVIAGTVFSQTLINLLALGILLAVTFTSVPLLHGNIGGVAGALLVPLLVCVVVIVGPRLLARAARASSSRIAGAAATVTRLLNLARQGLVVFASPRYGPLAVFFQLFAWALQWLACYMVMLSLGLQSHGGLVAAAAILLAVNLSAVLPATPSNVGVFQAACLVVLAAYGVGAGTGLAYGIILQAVEVVTALVLGVPALLGEGISWRDIRTSGREVEEKDLAIDREAGR